MSADLFADLPMQASGPMVAACPECANPDACVYAIGCPGCDARLLAEIPPRLLALRLSSNLTQPKE